MTSFKHVHAAELALMRAETALGVASSQLGKADHPDGDTRRTFTGMANECVEIQGSIRSLLKKLRALRARRPA